MTTQKRNEKALIGDVSIDVSLALARERTKNLIDLLKTAVENDAYYSIEEIDRQLRSAIDSLLSDIKIKYGK